MERNSNIFSLQSNLNIPPHNLWKEFQIFENLQLNFKYIIIGVKKWFDELGELPEYLDPQLRQKVSTLSKQQYETQEKKDELQRLGRPEGI